MILKGTRLVTLKKGARLCGSPNALWVLTAGCLLCAAAFNKLRLTPRLPANDTRAPRTATLNTVTGPPALA
jgi:hypothetical protein